MLWHFISPSDDGCRSGKAQNDPLGFVTRGFFFVLRVGDSAGDEMRRKRKKGRATHDTFEDYRLIAVDML